MVDASHLNAKVWEVCRQFNALWEVELLDFVAAPPWTPDPNDPDYVPDPEDRRDQALVRRIEFGYPYELKVEPAELFPTQAEAQAELNKHWDYQIEHAQRAKLNPRLNLFKPRAR